MKIEDCFYLGHISKTNSFNGSVIVKLDVDDPEKYKKTESVFLNINGQLVPFFVKSFTIKPQNIASIAFEDINSEEEAEHLIDAEVYLPLSLLPPLTGNKFYFHEVVGFEVEDAVHGKLGIINRVLDMPRQAILEVKKEEKEILIPVTDDIIKDVNREQKTVFVETPEGLVDLYLS